MTGALTIEGKSYKLDITLRTHVIYEKITGKPVGEGMGTAENIMFIFAVLLSQNPNDFNMVFDDFFNYIDSHPEIYVEFFRWMTEYNQLQESLKGSEEESEEGKKKG